MRRALAVNLASLDPACKSNVSGPAHFSLAGDIYAYSCQQTIVAYDLARQAVAWTKPLQWPIKSLTGNDAVLMVYTDQSVRANGLTPATSSIVAIALDSQTGQQVWDRPVSVSSSYEPLPLTYWPARVAILPIAANQYAVVDNAGTEKWRLPPLADDVALADNGKLILATTTHISANTGERQRDATTNVYDAVSGTVVSHVPPVTTKPWSRYGTSFVGSHDLIDLRSGNVVRKLGLKSADFLQNLFLENDSGGVAPSALSAIDDTTSVRWTIPESVVGKFAVIDGRLFVTNTSGQVIEINEASGTELRRWKTRPTSVGTYWAILDYGPNLSAGPID